MLDIRLCFQQSDVLPSTNQALCRLNYTGIINYYAIRKPCEQRLITKEHIGIHIITLKRFYTPVI